MPVQKGTHEGNNFGSPTTVISDTVIPLKAVKPSRY